MGRVPAVGSQSAVSRAVPRVSGAAPGGYITDVPGIEVGHAEDPVALTGCTVIMCRRGAVAGVDVRGGAPGTRETDLLDPINLVSRVHAVLLAGGSAFGLDAAAGVMRYLEQRKIGFSTGIARVPIVPAAILYDLNLGRKDIRPDADMGYAACSNARPERGRRGQRGRGHRRLRRQAIWHGSGDEIRARQCQRESWQARGGGDCGSEFAR